MTNFTNFPLPGTQPDLSFYYNNDWYKYVPFAYASENYLINYTTPITLDDKSDPHTQAIGYIFIPEAGGNTTYSDPYIINFTKEAGGGGITFSDNQLNAISQWLPNKTLVFRITGGSGNYLFAEGFVAITTTEDLGRYVHVYFFHNEI